MPTGGLLSFINCLEFVPHWVCSIGLTDLEHTIMLSISVWFLWWLFFTYVHICSLLALGSAESPSPPHGPSQLLCWLPCGKPCCIAMGCCVPNTHFKCVGQKLFSYQGPCGDLRLCSNYVRCSWNRMDLRWIECNRCRHLYSYHLLGTETVFTHKIHSCPFFASATRKLCPYSLFIPILSCSIISLLNVQVLVSCLPHELVVVFCSNTRLQWRQASISW